MSEPSKHAVEAASKFPCRIGQERYYEDVVQSAIDAATAQLKILLEESESDFQREQRERIAAEQQVLVLREALDYYAKDAHTPLGPDKTIDDVEDGEIARKALSTSAEIASGYVPVEDVKPLLRLAPDREAFLSKHGDKFNK